MKKSPKSPATPAMPSPAAEAAAQVERLFGPAGDWHSDLVWHLFIDGVGNGPNPIVAITEAATARRMAREAAGELQLDHEADTESMDNDEAVFALGFALGARLGGAR